MGRLVRLGLSLPVRCPNVSLDERLEAPALLLAAHHVGVDPERESWIRVAELPYDVGRVPAVRHRDRGERVPQFVRVMPSGGGCSPRSSTSRSARFTTASTTS